MQKTIKVNDVTVTTATVDIQVIRIGSKQMTLAVFRQLPRMEILASDGTLLGHPWGWVNYDRTTDAWQPFIFSYQGLLYRDDIRLSDYSRIDSFAVVAAIEYRNERGELLDRSDRYRWPRPKISAVSTNCWNIVYRTGATSPIGHFFKTETRAWSFIANLRNSIAILQSVPQLFIAV